MSAYTTAYCGICGLPMAGGIGSTLRCPDDNNVAHNQWFGRPTFMLPAAPRDAEITALRAALDQERKKVKRMESAIKASIPSVEDYTRGRALIGGGTAEHHAHVALRMLRAALLSGEEAQ